MDVLVLNCGSSSIKFQLIDMENKVVIAKGKCDAIGYGTSHISYTNARDNYKNELDVAMPTHKEAIQAIFDNLMDPTYGVISSLDDISAVGHRIVHGGEKFSQAVLITDEILDEIRGVSNLAPLHNPLCIMGVEAIKSIAPNLKNVGVFDTAYHQTMPDFNYLYAIDYHYYEKYGIRKYGFHGSSYMFVIKRLAQILNKPVENINAIICHLGGGASACAIKNGKSYDTSMGLTPLEGLIMETRSGDLDPAIVTKIMREENLNCDQIDEILNKKSGRVGLCGIGDQRELVEAANSGNKRAILTRNMQSNVVKKYIGSYIAELNNVDALVFTGGIGENDEEEREAILNNMESVGIELDSSANIEGSRKESKISKETSKIPVYIIPTNEELEIAKQTVGVITNAN
ncbi:MAG: acetate kinase [Clostridia bacterium]